MACIAAEWITDMRIWTAASSAAGTLIVFILILIGGIIVCLAPMIALARRRAIDMCPGCHKTAVQFLRQDRGLTLTCPRCSHQWVAGTSPARPI